MKIKTMVEFCNEECHLIAYAIRRMLDDGERMLTIADFDEEQKAAVPIIKAAMLPIAEYLEKVAEETEEPEEPKGPRMTPDPPADLTAEIEALEADVKWLEENGDKVWLIQMADDKVINPRNFWTGVPESVAAMAAQKRALLHVLKARNAKGKA